MKYLLLIVFLMLGCAQKQVATVAEFDRVENFVKPIDSGLYFIREVGSKGTFGMKRKSPEEWHEKAKSVCPGGYKTLLLSNDELSYEGTNINFVGQFVVLTPDTKYTSSIDGIILCKSSSLSEDDAIKKLVDEYYIEPVEN